MGSSNRDRRLPGAGFDPTGCLPVHDASNECCNEADCNWRLLLPPRVRGCPNKLIGLSNFIRVAGLFVAYLMSYTSFRERGRPSIDAVDSLMLQQALLAYGLMSATIPCLKGFLGRFRTGDLAKLTESEIMHSYGARQYGSRSRSRSRSHGQSYALSLMDRQGGAGKVQRAKNQLPAILRPDGVHYSTHAYAQRSGDNGSGSVRSFGSEQMIIHRRVDYDVVAQ